MSDEDLDLDIELEKLRRRQKLARRNDDSEMVGPKKKNRLDPFKKSDRQFNWKLLIEEEAEEEDITDEPKDNE